MYSRLDTHDVDQRNDLAVAIRVTSDIAEDCRNTFRPGSTAYSGTAREMAGTVLNACLAIGFVLAIGL